MKLLATDLDRTLLPNGNISGINTIKLFNDITLEKCKVAYVTGRNLSLVKEAINEFGIRKPDYLISSVGSMVYMVKGGRFFLDKEWNKYVSKKCPKWNYNKIIKKLSKIKDLELQEKKALNNFKVSYYVNSDKIISKVKKEIRGFDSNIIYSWDPLKNIGLLDILPKAANKGEALKYLNRNKDFEDIVYCGDSGNDIDVISLGFKSILVKNSDKQLKDEVKELINKGKVDKKNIFVAKGNFTFRNKKLDGYYSSGIIEGMKFFGFI